MLQVCERFPQIGTIEDYLALPPGERLLYEQYTMAAVRAEAAHPVLKFDFTKGGGRR